MSSPQKQLIETIITCAPKIPSPLKSAASPHFSTDKFFRYVNNYEFCFRTFTKQRWLGRQLLEVFTSEFRAFSETYYLRALAKEKILVNGAPVKGDYILKNSDKIEHYTVRRELPVYNLPIEIIFDDEEVMGVDKPPSLPVHPCGAYNKNSLVRILELEQGVTNWHPIHRLDKLTSGLLILVKGKNNTVKYQKELKENNVHKKYLARVGGRLPQPKMTVDTPIYCVSVKHSKYSVATTPETVEQAKEALTRFEEVWYDEKTDSSLVECFPLTGRTHQIRVHLQSVQCSILNDVNYGGRKIGNLCLFELRKQYPEDFEMSRIVREGKLLTGKQLHDSIELEKQKPTPTTKQTSDEPGMVLTKQTNPTKDPEVFQGKRVLDENGLDMPADVTSGDAKIDLPPEKKLVVDKGTAIGLPHPTNTINEKEPLMPEVDEESDEMEMKMFFNYGDLDELPYTPFNEDRMMEIWLHSSAYVIKGKTLKSKDPYWVSKDLTWDSA